MPESPGPASDTPVVAYHGTCVDRWCRDSTYVDDLYVTTDRAVAEGYAREWEREGEAPLLVTVPLSAFSIDRFEPNAETVQQCDDGVWGDLGKAADALTWRDTLAINRTFAIADFSNRDKAHVAVAALPPQYRAFPGKRPG